ncbi:MAG: hypothetical protein LBR80_02840 [Deltaproteobacteria bacterium]|jgi:hypothetical protein|nr:hypothetical protein [Deltaproteobacteria bacterium]
MNSFDDPRLNLFLTALQSGHTVDTARKDAALNWKLLYNLKRNSPEFEAAWEEAVGLGRRVFSKVKSITEENITLFLEALSQGTTVNLAAEGSRINSASFYKLRHRNPEFSQRWTEAAEKGREVARTRYRDNQVATFLRELRAGKSAREASLVAGRDLTTFYRMKRREPQFAKDWEQAQHPREHGDFPVNPHGKPLSGPEWGGKGWSGGSGRPSLETNSPGGIRKPFGKDKSKS